MLFFPVRYVVSVRRLVLLGATVICLVLPPGIVRAQRSIPDDNLAYPVLIQLPNEPASGFYLNTGNSLYLVTAKHVLFDPPTGNPPTSHLHSGPMVLVSYSRDPKEPGTNRIKLIRRLCSGRRDHGTPRR